MKNTIRMLMTTVIVISLAISTIPHTTADVEGKSFMIYTGGAFQQDFSRFESFYNQSNSVYTKTDVNFNSDLEGIDALFLPGNSAMSELDFVAIAKWFAFGNKLLWVGGDSDFGGFFISQDLNPVLNEVGSVLRLDAGAVDDPEFNDGASYRVVADHAGDGPIATAITANISNVIAPFHGPTSVYYVDTNGNPQDLRAASPDDVEALIFSSAESTVIDQDLSLSLSDFYLTEVITGNYPLLVIEVMGNSAVIVSGESTFGNYKEMYGDVFEKSELTHAGKEITNNLIAYYYDNIYVDSNSLGETSTGLIKSSAELSFDFTYFMGFFGVFAIFITAIRRKSIN